MAVRWLAGGECPLSRVIHHLVMVSAGQEFQSRTWIDTPVSLEVASSLSGHRSSSSMILRPPAMCQTISARKHIRANLQTRGYDMAVRWLAGDEHHLCRGVFITWSWSVRIRDHVTGKIDTLVGLEVASSPSSHRLPHLVNPRPSATCQPSSMPVTN